MLRCGLATLLALVLVLWAMPARTVLAPVASAAELPAAIPNIYLHLPTEKNFLAGQAYTSDRRTGASKKYSPILDSRKVERKG